MPDVQRGIPTWVWRLCIVVVALAAGVAIYVWVMSPDQQQDTVAEQWIKAVSNYGIEPAYPPQEDLYVGDVFAIIAGDVTRDISADPLPTRAIKLRHLDLTEKIEKEYAQSYHFPTTLDAPDKGKIWPQTETSSSVFAKTDVMKSLPIALLPDFTIKAKKRATFDTGALTDLAEQFGMTVSRDRLTSFKLEGILTYGVSALDAEIALNGFCNDKVTKSVCNDAGLRLQLSNILGDAIKEKVKNGSFRYIVELEIINRVYLIRRIETSIDDARGLDVNAKAGAVLPTPTPTETPSEATSASGTVESKSGSLISVTPQTFERPVTFGFRSVRIHFDQ